MPIINVTYHNAYGYDQNFISVLLLLDQYSEILKGEIIYFGRIEIFISDGTLQLLAVMLGDRHVGTRVSNKSCQHPRQVPKEFYHL